MLENWAKIYRRVTAFAATISRIKDSAIHETIDYGRKLITKMDNGWLLPSLTMVPRHASILEIKTCTWGGHDEHDAHKQDGLKSDRQTYFFFPYCKS